MKFTICELIYSGLHEPFLNVSVLNAHAFQEKKDSKEFGLLLKRPERCFTCDGKDVSGIQNFLHI